MFGLVWLLAWTLTPLFLAWTEGSNYSSASLLIAMGLSAHALSVILIAHYLRRRAPESFTNETWENTAARGVVPPWVSKLGLAGNGMFISGAAIAFLLLCGLLDYSEDTLLGVFTFSRVSS